MAALWRGSDLVDEHISDQPVAPLAPRIATRAAEHSLPAGLIAALDLHLRAHSAGERLDEVIEELTRIREEAGWPPLAAPIGQVLASQALLHVLSAERYQTVVDELRDLLAGRYGEPPGEISPQVRRAVELTSDGQPPTPEIPDLAQLREQYAGIAASEEELLLLALFGDDAKLLLETIRGRGRSDSLEGGGVDASRAERIREIVRIVQESGVGEVTIEDAGLRVTVRRTPDNVPAPVAAAPEATVEEDLTSAAGPAGPPVDPGSFGSRRPMVGTFYRAPSPGSPPFVEEGDAVAIGQTLCILEAMKLMNEVKADQEGSSAGSSRRTPSRSSTASSCSSSSRSTAARPGCRRCSAELLVANRGEIAVRVIRALRELGIEAVAVYSDRGQGRRARPSRRPRGLHRAAAAHGELPEHRVRRRRCEHDRLRGRSSRLWLPGRTARVCRGLRGQRPRLHRPGCKGDGADGRQGRGEGGDARGRRPARARTEEATTLDQARELAPGLGFPVLLKAAAGGGGRGMRLVTSDDELEDAYATASGEAEAAFGDGSIYLEKAVVPARHVEIQVLADG